MHLLFPRNGIRLHLTMNCGNQACLRFKVGYDSMENVNVELIDIIICVCVICPQGCVHIGPASLISNAYDNNTLTSF
jgi:hypothetical protein